MSRTVPTSIATAEFLLSTGGNADKALPQDPKERKDFLLNYLDHQYRLCGSRRCEECNATVRYAMRVVSVAENNDTRDYTVLCRRCIEAEKAFSKKVLVYAAGVVFEEFVNPRPPVSRLTPPKSRAA
jgi:hypothetical protein